MKLSNYLKGVTSKFKDSRVVKNVRELVESIIEHKNIRLWRISENKAEYERRKRLLDGTLKSILNEEKIAEGIREHSVRALGEEERLCDYFK